MTILNTSVSGMLADSRTGCRRSLRMSRTPRRPATRTSRRIFRPWSTQVSNTDPPAAGSRPPRSLNALQGNVVSSATATNLAVQGSGFFVVSDSSGNLYLTRNGSFVPDASGNLVNSSGYYLMGSDIRNGQTAAGQFAEQPEEGQRRVLRRDRLADDRRFDCGQSAFDGDAGRRREPAVGNRRARPTPTRRRSSSTTISAGRTRSISI